MDQNKTDIIMRFVQKGRPVWAEGALELTPDDPMTSDFKSATYDDYSNFFQVTKFDFGFKLDGNDEGVSTFSQQKTQGGSAKTSGSKGDFYRWRSAKEGEYRNIKYPLEFDVFNFSRIVDAASPVFFKSCCNTISFDKAVLVKRLAQGDLAGVSRPSLGYLRIEFTEVLIIKLEWNDGDVIEEECSFICREFDLTYKQQMVEGALRPGSTPVSWKQSRDSTSSSGGA